MRMARTLSGRYALALSVALNPGRGVTRLSGKSDPVAINNVSPAPGCRRARKNSRNGRLGYCRIWRAIISGGPLLVRSYNTKSSFLGVDESAANQKILVSAGLGAPLGSVKVLVG